MQVMSDSIVNPVYVATEAYQYPRIFARSGESRDPWPLLSLRRGCIRIPMDMYRDQWHAQALSDQSQERPYSFNNESQLHLQPAYVTATLSSEYLVSLKEVLLYHSKGAPHHTSHTVPVRRGFQPSVTFHALSPSPG